MHRSDWLLNLILVAAVTVGLGFYAGWTFALLLALFLWGYIGQADSRLVGFLRDWTGRSLLRSAAPLAGLLGLFAVSLALAGSLSSRPLLVVLVYLFAPWALVQFHARLSKGQESRPLTPLLLAVLCLWLPIETGLLPGLKLPSDRGVPVSHLLGLVAALYLFQVTARLEGMGYTYRLSRRDWSLSTIYFGLFAAVIGVPVAVSLHFIASSAEVPPIWSWPLRGLFIFFFIAVPEEILFRGILQNLLQKRLRGRMWPALVVASVIFGLAHSNNSNPPYAPIHLPLVGEILLPWVYVLLASIAGVFYGLAYVKRGKLTAAAIVHAMVDLWWSLFFHG
ncbi:MAG: lysostaphin resistance A-like protein [Acidobacteriota bacterium]